MPEQPVRTYAPAGMRQFFTWQFWAALVGVAATLAVALMVRERTTSSGLDLDRALEPAEHRIDLVVPIVEARPDPGFAVANGVTTARLTLVLDAGRRVTIPQGTPGESTCTFGVAEAAPCALAADLLGEAVVWFSLVAAPQRSSIDLPPIVELRDDRWTLLRNGWEVQRAPLVERACAEDTTSLADFVRRFGPTSSTTFNLGRQEIVRVTCGAP